MSISKERDKITNYIFLDEKPEKADLALVFGTRHREAIEKTYELYRAGFIDKILISGGKNRVTGENEAEEMSKKLIMLGVNFEDIVLENKSVNSLENVLFSKKIIDEKIGFKLIKKIIAITKNYHSRRALMTIKKYFPDYIKIIPITYQVGGLTKENWSDSATGKEKVIGEFEKIKIYLEKGDIVEL